MQWNVLSMMAVLYSSGNLDNIIKIYEQAQEITLPHRTFKERPYTHYRRMPVP